MIAAPIPVSAEKQSSCSHCDQHPSQIKSNQLRLIKQFFICLFGFFCFSFLVNVFLKRNLDLEKYVRHSIALNEPSQNELPEWPELR